VFPNCSLDRTSSLDSQLNSLHKLFEIGFRPNFHSAWLASRFAALKLTERPNLKSPAPSKSAKERPPEVQGRLKAFATCPDEDVVPHRKDTPYIAFGGNGYRTLLVITETPFRKSRADAAISNRPS